MPRAKYTAEQKFELIQKFRDSGLSKRRFERENGLSDSRLSRWREQYRRLGMAGLSEATTAKRYSKEIKLAAVTAYLDGAWSASRVMMHFDIRSITQLQYWVRQYNGNEEMADTPSSRRVPDMVRKITYEERVEIVEYALAHNRNYSETAEKFDLTYQQVYLWVKKVYADGFPALVDRRGRKKPADEMSDLDKANLRIRQLEAQLKSSEMEVAFAKKLKEILERGR